MLNFWFVSAISLLMILLGIALQIARRISETQNGMCMGCHSEPPVLMATGFAVPAKNVFSFVSTQFLTVNITIYFVIPVAHNSDRSLFSRRSSSYPLPTFGQ